MHVVLCCPVKENQNKTFFLLTFVRFVFVLFFSERWQLTLFQFAVNGFSLPVLDWLLIEHPYNRTENKST